ncbi:Cellobiose dehydrogenase [Neofusicoccum parvum]|uniref:Cellobiose dehydrogenase n=1 Tax=Neofusicoccum parvum TaxID=310453 RepID=A0ACB5SJ13_9PEZI|nr:Cellobiose dehydrogenase [Neofusicoccum parvum]
MRSTFAAVAALAGAASAATTTSAYTDSTTGITFQRWVDEDTGFAFGMALPESPEKDFIGQIVAPGAGWAGMSMTSSMMASTLIAAWPSGEDVIASVRKTNAYSSPSVMDGATLASIPEGTFVNSTHFSYTFLCTGCLTGDSGSFDVTGETAVLGWALSKTAPTTPTSVTSALGYHAAGFGAFGMPIADAEQAEYSTWAKLATGSSSGSSGTGTTTGSNSTTTPGASTTPVSTPLPAPVTLNTTYDYIVVGGGAAGIVAAQRLAESKKSVLLIERGGASSASSGGNDYVDWNNTVTPYDVPAYGYAVEQTGDVSYCTDTASQAGCILGGSTVINAEMFVKPQEADFENWPQGWSYSDIQASAESFYERNPGTTTPSSDGRRYNQGVFQILGNLLKGNGWNEVDAVEEPNKKVNVYSHPPMNIQDSLRAGPVLTYLPLAQEMDNFKLQLNTKVLRVARTGSTVTGVEVQTESGATQLINLKANGKVVLAAGALSTPRLLFNSGIGPADQLEIVANGNTGISLNSSDYIELPVGKGLKDHPILSMQVNILGGSNLTVFDPTNPSDNDIALYKQGAGPLAEGMQRLNFWTSVEGSDGKTRYVQGTTSVASSSAIKVKVYLTHGLTSEGRLGITADGATELITEPWLTTDADKEALTKFVNEFFGYVQKSGNLSVTSSTGGNITAADMIAKLTTGSHFVSTAKMGTDSGLENNGTAVVDTDCKVYGTDNLYIVDASIHPDLPTGNTQAIVYVVAEHAAKKIAGATTTTAATGSTSGSVSSESAVASAESVLSSSAVSSSAAASTEVATTTVVQNGYTTTIYFTATPVASSAAAGVATSAAVQTTEVVQNGYTTTVYYTQTAHAAGQTHAAGNQGQGNHGNQGGHVYTSVATQVQNGYTTTVTYTQTAPTVGASSTLATSVVAAAVSSAAGGAASYPTFVPTGVASNWTNTIPSAALTQVIATPTGANAPDKPLPAGTRIKDVLEWFTYIFESLIRGKKSSQ